MAAVRDAGGLVLRVMRGQVVLRELPEEPSAIVWTPQPGQRSVRTHRGRVLAIGTPMVAYGKVIVPHDFSVGDIVQFHYVHNREAFTMAWPPDGKPATWVPQDAVDGVWEDYSFCKSCGKWLNEEGAGFCDDKCWKAWLARS